MILESIFACMTIYHRARMLRNTYFQPAQDPILSLESDQDKHLVIYQGAYIIGYIHIVLHEAKLEARCKH